MKKLFVFAAFMFAEFSVYAQITPPVVPPALPVPEYYTEGKILNNVFIPPYSLRVVISSGGNITANVTGSTVTVLVPGYVNVTGSTVTITKIVDKVNVTGSTVVVTKIVDNVNVTYSTVTITNGFIDVTGATVTITNGWIDVTGSTVTVTKITDIVNVTGSTITITNPTICTTGSTVTFTNTSIDITGSTVTVSNLSDISVNGSTITAVDWRYYLKTSSGTSGKLTGITDATIVVTENVYNWSFKYRNLVNLESTAAVNPTIYGTDITFFDGDSDTESPGVPMPVTFNIAMPIESTMTYVINTLK